MARVHGKRRNGRLAAIAVACAATASMAGADTVVAARTIRAHTLLSPDDLAVKPGTISGAFTSTEEVSGMETRVAIYAGRPLRPGDVGPPALIDRNQIVPLAYDGGGLTIATEGRALDRAGAGDMARVMNLASRATVVGRVQPDGSVLVSR